LLGYLGNQAHGTLWAYTPGKQEFLQNGRQGNTPDPELTERGK